MSNKIDPLTQIAVDRLSKALTESFVPTHVSSNGGDTIYVYLSPDAANLLTHIISSKKDRRDPTD